MRGVSALTSWGGMDKVNWKQVEVDTCTTTLIGLWKLWTRSAIAAREWPIRPFGQQERVRDRVIKAQQEAELRAAQQAEEQRARQEAIQQAARGRAAASSTQKPRPRPRPR